MRKKIILASIVVLLTILLSIPMVILRLSFSIKFHLKPDCSSPEKALEFYNANAGLFNKVVEELSPLPNRIQITEFDFNRQGTGWKYYQRTNYVLKDTSNEVNISREQLKQLDDSVITAALWYLKPVKIEKRDNCIVFLQSINTTYSSGLAYSPHKKPFSLYIYEWVELKDEWFYFEEE